MGSGKHHFPEFQIQFVGFGFGLREIERTEMRVRRRIVI
jgi:hypothetical protein